MKNNLLLTTALVAATLSISSTANAELTVQQGDKVYRIENVEDINNYSSVDKSLYDVISFDEFIGADENAKEDLGNIVVINFENSIDFPDCIINGSRMYLCKDGNIRKLLSDSEEIFEIADRESAIKIFEELYYQYII